MVFEYRFAPHGFSLFSEASAHFCKAVVRQLSRMLDKRSKAVIEFTQRNDLGRLDKGTSSAEPPRF